ncbi:MAG: 3'-5' exonuclease [Myxococcota bacterium]
MGSALPEGIQRSLVALRAKGRTLPVGEVAQRLLALDARPPLPLARRLVAGLLGRAPNALPETLEPTELRLPAETRAARLSLADAAFAVVDLETTGLSRQNDAIIEIGAVRVRAGRLEDRFETLVRPPGPGPLSSAIVSLTGIEDHMLLDAPPLHRALERFRRWLDVTPGAIWVAHNARFDHGFLSRAFEAQWGAAPRVAVLCTQRMSRRLMPKLGRYNLDHLCAQFGIRNRARHRALGDADATARAWVELLVLAEQAGHRSVGDLLDLQDAPTRRRRKRR